MAVVERKNRRGIVYWVANEWNGKQEAERVGTVRRDAEVRDRQMKAEIKAGTYRPKEGPRTTELGPFADEWARDRTNAGAKEERRQLRLYLQPREWLTKKRVAEVDHGDMDRLAEQLRAERKTDGSRRLSDKTISNFFDTLTQVFKSSIRRGLRATNPIMLEKKLDRTPKEEREIYSPTELILLTRHHEIPEPVRILNAMCLLAGLREGEACGRRWRDITDGAEGDLPAMDVKTQYNDQPLKTKRPRVVPVHPELQRVLLAWASAGFRAYVGRDPQPEDFVVPNCQPRARSKCWARTTYYVAFIESAQAAGVRPRTLHATRHTFITLCRRAGAIKDHLRVVTHNPRGDIVDRYTHLDWEPLCKAVLALDLEALQGAPRRLGTPRNPVGFLARVGGVTPQNGSVQLAPNKGLSPELCGESWLSRCLAIGPIQEPIQGIRGESGGQLGKPTTTDTDSEESFRAALVEHSERVAVADLLARPIAKVVDTDGAAESEVARG